MNKKYDYRSGGGDDGMRQPPKEERRYRVKDLDEMPPMQKFKSYPDKSGGGDKWRDKGGDSRGGGGGRSSDNWGQGSGGGGGHEKRRDLRERIREVN